MTRRPRRAGRSEFLLLVLLAATSPSRNDSFLLQQQRTPSPSLISPSTRALPRGRQSHRRGAAAALRLAPEEERSEEPVGDALSRRDCLNGGFGVLLASSAFSPLSPPLAVAAEAPSFVQKYEDFVQTDEGWQYKDVKPGDGGVVIEDGDRVVFDWSGYTIGYFGRPFEAKGGPQGGAFDKELDYFRTTVGSGATIKGLECALRSMKPGGVRQIVIPYGPLSYPETDPEHTKVGPKPTTFSGQRALNFVLENPRVDRTLLFNVKVIRVDKKDGKGGFVRG